jgi:hypothetical protein
MFSPEDFKSEDQGLGDVTVKGDDIGDLIRNGFRQSLNNSGGIRKALGGGG